MLNYQRVPFDRSWMDSPVFNSHIQMSLDDSMMDDIERFVCSSAATARKNRHTCRRDSGYRMYAAPSPQSLRVNPNGDKLEWVNISTCGSPIRVPTFGKEWRLPIAMFSEKSRFKNSRSGEMVKCQTKTVVA